MGWDRQGKIQQQRKMKQQAGAGQTARKENTMGIRGREKPPP